MILCRELTKDEIERIARQHMDYGQHIDAHAFARALFEAARVKQTQEREANVHS